MRAIKGFSDGAGFEQCWAGASAGQDAKRSVEGTAPATQSTGAAGDQQAGRRLATCPVSEGQKPAAIAYSTWKTTTVFSAIPRPKVDLASKRSSPPTWRKRAAVAMAA